MKQGPYESLIQFLISFKQIEVAIFFETDSSVIPHLKSTTFIFKLFKKKQINIVNYYKNLT
jgi:hypothetical protein